MDFVAELRRLSINCNFGGTLNDTLRDRLVCGLRQEFIQKRLLSETDLDLNKAIQLSVAMETAARDAAEVHNRQETVHNVHAKVPKHKPKSKNKPKLDKPAQKPCYRCNGEHSPQNCKHIDSICNFCSKKGHIERACLKKKRQQRRNVNQLDEMVDEEPILHVNQLNDNDTHANAIMLKPKVGTSIIKMELDTGTALSIISKMLYDSKFSECKLQQTSTVLRSYSDHTVKPLGKIRTKVSINNQTADLDLYVVPQNVPSLFERDWLEKLKLNWTEIKSLRPEQKLSSILEANGEVFSAGIGKLKNITASLKLKEGTQPRFLKARNVPYSSRPKIEAELDRLEKEGIIQPVDLSDWSIPIVPVMKSNGTDVRICGDYHVTLNPGLCVDKYPLPKIEGIFASLSGGEKFSKIDLTQAYLQMEVDDNSKEYLTINTHKGLYRHNRLAFGVASAPSLWQRAIDQVLQKIPFTKCILDDIIISGKDDEEHLNNLKSVLERLKQYGLRANLKKCLFFQERISYCGHEIDKKGLHKSPSKVKAMLEVRRPENVSELRSFLGLVNYYHRFIQNLSTIAAPLHELLQSKVKWNWTENCENSFLMIKEAICSEQVLCHYDPEKPLKLACDASCYGIGCVLSHTFPDGSERPIAFASRTLNKAEKRILSD